MIAVWDYLLNKGTDDISSVIIFVYFYEAMIH